MGNDQDTRQYTQPQPPAHDERHRGRWLAIGGLGAMALAGAAAAALSLSGTASSATTHEHAPEPVTVSVTSPTSGSVISSDQVTVRGTVTPAEATVTVQNHPAAVGNGVFTASATLHRGKTTIDVIASAPGVAPASTTVVVARPQPPHKPKPTTTTVVVSAPTSSSTNCGGGTTAGPNTSCPFAENVRAAYEASGPGTVTAYSPVTGRAYVLDCSYGSYVTCAGGDDASVSFPSEADPGYSSSYDAGSCGDGLSVGPHTTCPFAENVRSAYESDGPGTLDVYSPVTNRTYVMSCDGESPVVCTGGHGAAVYIY